MSFGGRARLIRQFVSKVCRIIDCEQLFLERVIVAPVVENFVGLLGLGMHYFWVSTSGVRLFRFVAWDVFSQVGSIL